VTWAQQVSGTVEDLLAIDFVSDSIGWACGDVGTIIKTVDGGATWLPQVSGVTGSLSAASFFDSLRGVIAGYDVPAPAGTSTALRTSDGGATWVAQSLGVLSTVFDVEMVTPAIGWVCGLYPFLLQKTIDGGASWLPTSIVTGSESLLGISAVSATDAWVVGSNGFVSRTINGTDWNNQTSGTSALLSDVKFVNTMEGWACGATSPGLPESTAVVFSSADSGSSWQQQSIPTTSTVAAIDSPDVNMGAMSFSGTVTITINSGQPAATVLSPDDIVSIFKKTYLYVQRISDNAIQWVDLLGEMTANR
jgi:photosystem II stability/assembly factor-like uncharacterized protein